MLKKTIKSALSILFWKIKQEIHPTKVNNDENLSGSTIPYF